MSYTNLNSYTVDGYQRVSYSRPSARLDYRESGGNDGDHVSGDGIIISKDLILGCRPESTDDFGPFVYEPTWCVYIRARDNVDMGRYVRRVTFRMSPRLPLRLHVADTAPFEITEVLSTDFPLDLQVDYLDPTMSPTTYMYKPNDAFDGKYNVDLRLNFQGHERRDKMFFVNPPISMQRALTSPPPLPPPPSPSSQRLPQPVPSLAELQLQMYKTQRAETDKAYKKPKTYSELLKETREAGAPRPIFNVRVPHPSLSELSPDKPSDS